MMKPTTNTLRKQRLCIAYASARQFVIPDRRHVSGQTESNSQGLVIRLIPETRVSYGGFRARPTDAALALAAAAVAPTAWAAAAVSMPSAHRDAVRCIAHGSRRARASSSRPKVCPTSCWGGTPKNQGRALICRSVFYL